MRAGFPKDLSREVIRALRGRRSQGALSALLGFSYNQVYLWESGRREIRWSDFEKLCHALNRPLRETLTEHFHVEWNNGIGGVLSSVLKGRKRVAVAKDLGVSAVKITRWTRPEADPPLEDALRLLHLVHLHFFELLDAVIGKGRLAPIQDIIKRNLALKQTLFALPYAGAVAAGIFLQDYVALKTHDDSFLARRLGLTAAEVRRALLALQSNGHIEFSEGKYRGQSFSINLASDREQFLRNAQYWSERVARLPVRLDRRSGLGYRTFVMSKAGIDKLRRAQVDYYNAISEIIARETANPEHVVLVNFHTVLLDEA